MESRLERQNVERDGFDQVSWKIYDAWLLSKKLDPNGTAMPRKTIPLVSSRASLGKIFQRYWRVEAGSETELLVTAPAQVLRLAS